MPFGFRRFSPDKLASKIAAFESGHQCLSASAAFLPVSGFGRVRLVGNVTNAFRLPPLFSQVVL